MDTDRTFSPWSYLEVICPLLFDVSPIPWRVKVRWRVLFLLEGHGSLLVLGTSEIIYSFLNLLCSAFSLLSGALHSCTVLGSFVGVHGNLGLDGVNGA